MLVTRFLETIQEYYFNPTTTTTTTLPRYYYRSFLPSTTTTTTTTATSRAATVTSSHQLLLRFHHYYHHFFPQPLRPSALLNFLDHQHRLDAVLPDLHRTAVKLARPPLDSLRAILPEPLQSLVPTFADSASESGSLLHAILPAPLLERLAAVGGPTSSGALLATSLALLLPLLLLAVRAMASWRSYLAGGRYSPFAATAPRGLSPQVNEGDYHYIGPDDIVDPPAESRGGHGHSGRQLDDPKKPDVLILRHRGYTYPMHFPPYCIGEGILRVGELRRYAAEKTGTADPRRIKLLYKGRTLKDDAVAAREEGLKQNSELTCIISESAISHGSSDESESASDSDFYKASAGRTERAQSAIDTGDHHAPRVDVDGTIINDSPRRHRSKKQDGRHSREKDDAHLNIPTPTKPSSTSRPTTPSNASTAAHPPPPAATPTPPAPTAAPKGPMGELDAITHEFRSKWVPMCDTFLANPPADAKARNMEYTKLSESILAQIIFKLDGVSTDGDPDARARRKAVIQETQGVLNKLDAVGKPDGSSAKD